MKNLTKNITLSFFLASAAALCALPVPYTSFSKDHAVGFEINARGTVGVGVNYSYRLNKGFFGQDLYLQGAVGFPLFLISPFDTFNGAVGAAGLLSPRSPLGVMTALRLTGSWQTQVLGRFFSWGFETEAMPGIFGKGGFFALHLRWQQNIFTHITHSDYVHSTFANRGTDASGPDDGWYANTATRFGIGAGGGFNIAQVVEFSLTAGAYLTPNPFGIFFEGMMFGYLPFYMELGIGSRF
jgi:hypothetical protein